MLDPGFEVVPRAEISDALVQSAAEHFGLGPVRECRDLGGAFNLNIALEVPGKTFVLRVYRSWKTPERLEFMRTVRIKLSQQGLPVPEPIGWTTEQSLGLDGHCLVELEEYVPHDGVADDWQSYEKAFEMLGRLHDAMAPLGEQLTFVPAKAHNYATLPEMLTWIEQTQSAIRTIDATESNPRYFDAMKLWEDAMALLIEMQDWWTSVGSRLPGQLVHGDYNGGTNVLFQGQQIVAVLDFDLMDIHERVYDLAYSFFFMGSLEYGVPLESRQWGRIGQMVAAYNRGTGNPLSKMEWDALPFVMARVPLYWVAAAGFMPDPIQAVLEEAEAIETSRWALRNLPGRL